MDTGIKKYEGDKLTGRWVDNEKDGRKRTICVIARDDKKDENDQTYIGYYHDVNNTDFGCNLSISVDSKDVCFQYVRPGDKDGKTIKMKIFSHAEFMDLLDLILK